MEKDKIYVVMVIEDIVDEPLPNGGIKGSSRIVGWYKDKDHAFEMLRIDNAGMHEYLYDYALVEEIKEGVYQHAMKDERWFFKYDEARRSYQPMSAPECFEHLVGLTIG